jgi:muramoyltetrapeptide carboxypeptidase
MVYGTRLPPVLARGDTIGVCAPSGAVPRDRLEQGITVLRDMGFRVCVTGGVSLKKRYLAGEDETRARDLESLFADPGVHGVLCARGGYGALRMVRHIDYEKILENPKRLVGFSDCTALLTAVRMRTGMAVIHGPVVTSLADGAHETRESLFNALVKEPEPVIARGRTAVVGGSARGRLEGGNLATLAHLTGTPFQPDFRGAVVFLEDVSEPPYKIDRMLTHMTMAGVFEEVAGVVTGSFENCGDQEEIHEILAEVFQRFGVPVLSGLDCGHGPVNLCLPLGTGVVVDTDSLTLGGL